MGICNSKNLLNYRQKQPIGTILGARLLFFVTLEALLRFFFNTRRIHV